MRWLTVLCLLCSMMLAGGETAGPWTVAHERALWRDQPGALLVSTNGVEFTPAVKKEESTKREFLPWDDIQQLTLTDRRIEIVTYRDVTWQFGRDRMLRFQQTGAGASFANAAPLLRAGLGERLITALRSGAGSLAPDTVRWRIAAKRTGLIHGAEGALIFTGEELIFDAKRDGESRAWPVATISTIAQTGSLALAVTVPERALSDEGGYRSFNFQLKQPLEARQYRELWRAIERAHGTRLRFEGIE